MQRGLIHNIMFAAFALIVIAFIFLFFTSRPFWSAPNEMDANIIANSIASSISVLSVSAGSITEEFSANWDIKIKGQKLVVFREKIKSGEVVLATNFPIADTEMHDVKKLTLKNEGGIIALKKE